jgi:transcriptional regulator with XRE-family HTH domain
VPRARRKRYRSEARRRPGVRKAAVDLGERVRALRAERKLTQERLGELAGLDDKHVQAVERGATNVTLATLVGLARALRVDVRNLFE